VSRDLAGKLLAVGVRLLPEHRREWGRAMLAELAAIGPGRARLSFAASCLGAMVRQPAVLRRAGYPVLLAVVVVIAGVRVAKVANPDLRISLLIVVASLVAVSWWGRRPGPLGPVGPSLPARLTRLGGYGLVGLLVVMMAPTLWRDSDIAANYVAAGLVVTAILSAMLIGFLVLTAQRSSATNWVLSVGLGAGVLGALGWGVAVVAARPIPTDITTALVALTAAMAVAATVTLARPAARLRHGVLAALTSGLVGALLLFEELELLAHLGPASLIPDLARPALTAADDLAQSRFELEDPYVVVVFGAFLLAVALVVAGLATRSKSRSVQPYAPSGN